MPMLRSQTMRTWWLAPDTSEGRRPTGSSHPRVAGHGRDAREKGSSLRSRRMLLTTPSQAGTLEFSGRDGEVHPAVFAPRPWRVLPGGPRRAEGMSSRRWLAAPRINPPTRPGT